MSRRAERRHQVQRIAAKRRRFMKAWPWGYMRERSDNELATRHPLDCGRRCLLCHGDKLLGAGRRRAEAKRDARREIDNAS